MISELGDNILETANKMAERAHLQLYRTSGTTQPESSEMKYGELGIGYKKNHEKIFIKNTEDTISEFSSDTLLKEVRDTQDGKVASSTGLVADYTSETGVVDYRYSPSSPALAEFDNMNDSVDYLASQLQVCLDQIEEFKQNIYVIDTNFTVEPNVSFTSYIVSYECINNESPTTPESCTITKYVNNGSGSVILDNTYTASASTESQITGNKEQFVLEVVPDLPGALNIKSELTRYICYVGASSATTMTAQIVEGFDKYASDGVKFACDTVDTDNGDYLWFIVPSFISIQYVTSQGMEVTLNNEVQTITNTLGTFKCYRSYKQLAEATWEPVVFHIQI